MLDYGVTELLKLNDENIQPPFGFVFESEFLNLEIGKDARRETIENVLNIGKSLPNPKALSCPLSSLVPRVPQESGLVQGWESVC